jgi:RimJ/RimL family protein N-acetyltransferase
MIDQDLFFRQWSHSETERGSCFDLCTPASSQIDLYRTATSEDRLLMRHDVCDPIVVGGWVEGIDYYRVLPITAVLGARIVGNTTLHFFEGYKRHIGEIRIFLAEDFRMRGLGTRMLKAVIDLARKHGLYLLEFRWSL